MDEKAVVILSKTEGALHEYFKKNSLKLEDVKGLIGKGDIRDLGYKLRVLDKNNAVKTETNAEVSLAYEAAIYKIDNHQNDNNTGHLWFMIDTDHEVANYS